jgi:hypothetical protein
MSVQNQTEKAAISVAEMARLVGLSRGRFYQLIGTTFPHPIYDATTRRPFYDADLQAVCLEVRRRNCGVDGRPVLFYARRSQIVPGNRQPRPTKKKPSPPVSDKHDDLTDGLRALGLVTVTASQVDAAMKVLYPNGASNVAHGEVLRAVFLHLRAQESSR